MTPVTPVTELIGLALGVAVVLGLYALVCSARYDVTLEHVFGYRVETKTFRCIGFEYETREAREERRST